MFKSRSFCTVLTLSTFFCLLAKCVPIQSHAQQHHGVEGLNDYLLPDVFRPFHYEVSLIPFLNDNVPEGENAFTFKGEVKISLACKETGVNEIKLHAHNEISIGSLEDISVHLRQNSTSGIPVSEMTRSNDDKSFLTIRLAENLDAAEEYVLRVKYSGVLNDQLNGFYRSSYTEGSEKQWLAVTQFESTGARRAFPCFDEPALKAKFKVRVAKSEGYVVQGNMPIQNDNAVVEEYPSMTWTEFEETASRMATYTVAFTVNKFAFLDGGSSGSPPVHYATWSRQKSVENGAYANYITPKVVAFLEDLTGEAFGLPKIEQVAVPDFPVGAQENWGLITYRETALLYDELTDSASNKQRVGTVVAHEVAHQWFGNLVTPSWWSDLWLNEGFATYYEYHSFIDGDESTWKLNEQFIYEEMNTAMVTDALESTHPLVRLVDSPSTIDSMFDNISYNKGGCIVRFLVNLFGEQVFKYGLRNYFSFNEEGNAETRDFWDALSRGIAGELLPPGYALQDVMDAWMNQAGYPVVNVVRKYDTNKIVRVSQSRFLNLPGATTPNEIWIVPLTWTSESALDFNNLTVQYWLENNETEISIDIGGDDWILINLQRTGFYRVNYDVRNWQMLARSLNSSDKFAQLHVINRAQILDDSLALARAKLLDYTTALDMTNYLNFETEYLPWATAFKSLEYIYDRLNSEEASRYQFEVYLLNRAKPIYNQMGGFEIPAEGDSHTESLTRTSILEWSCKLNDDACNTEAFNLFVAWFNTENPDSNNPIDPNFKSVVYCSGMRNGDFEKTQFLVERYLGAVENPTEQARIIAALGSSTNVTFLNEYLEMSITDGSPIRSQDTMAVITSVYNNPIGVDAALDFVFSNYLLVNENMGVLSNIGRVFSGLSEKLNTIEQREKLQSFLDNSSEVISEGARPSIVGAIRTVDENIQWHLDHKATVVEYFRMKNSANILSSSAFLLLAFNFVMYMI